jgi:hypothetical protein
MHAIGSWRFQSQRSEDRGRAFAPDVKAVNQHIEDRAIARTVLGLQNSMWCFSTFRFLCGAAQQAGKIMAQCVLGDQLLVP